MFFTQVARFVHTYLREPQETTFYSDSDQLILIDVTLVMIGWAYS